MAEKGGHWVKSAGGGSSFVQAGGAGGHIEGSDTGVKWVGGAGELVPAKMRQEMLAAVERGDPYYFWTDERSGREAVYRLGAKSRFGNVAREQIERLTMKELRLWSAH
jgi:hypothetical protein